MRPMHSQQLTHSVLAAVQDGVSNVIPLSLQTHMR
jgi:hypothetical protein